MQSRPTPKKAAVAQNATPDLGRFARFIRRMEGAGPKVILDRLKEDWQWSTGGDVDEEVRVDVITLHRPLLMVEQLVLEKQLWLLTGFQMQNLGQERTLPKPECNTGRILELYGNLCKSMLCPCVTLLCKL